MKFRLVIAGAVFCATVAILISTWVVQRDETESIHFRTPVEHPLTAKLIATAEGQTGNMAPVFSWQDEQGLTVNTKALNENKPLLIYFIDKECPCSRDAAVFINQLQHAYGKSLIVVGVINAPAEVATAWAQQTHARFPVIADAECAIIEAYQVESSASSILVAPGGLMARSNPGYNAAIIADLSNRIGQYTHLASADLNLKTAPTKLTSGCPLK